MDRKEAVRQAGKKVPGSVDTAEMFLLGCELTGCSSFHPIYSTGLLAGTMQYQIS